MSEEGTRVAQARPIRTFVIGNNVSFQAVDDLEEELLPDEDRVRLHKKFNVPEDRKLHHADQRKTRRQVFGQVVSQPGGPPQKPIVPQPKPSQQATPDQTEKPRAEPPDGVLGEGLQQFVGRFVGNGYNMILRPQNGPGFAFTETGKTSSREILIESNFTHEELTFADETVLGNVPNRGFDTQPDVNLRGVPYMQVVQDLSNPRDSLANLDPKNAKTIHFEQGLFMRTPALFTVDKFKFENGKWSPPENRREILGPTISRMASIPHGTTINAQALEPTRVKKPPEFKGLNDKIIRPFRFGENAVTSALANFFDQLEKPTVVHQDRIPSQLPKYIANGVITPEEYWNPNNILANYNKSVDIDSHVTFTVDTKPKFKPGIWGGGTGNIAQLAEHEVDTREVTVREGDKQVVKERQIVDDDGKPITRTNVAGKDRKSLANANAVRMTCTYWVSTVKETFSVGPFNLEAEKKKPGNANKVNADLWPVRKSQKAPGKHQPTFQFQVPNIVGTRKAEVRYTQIQYSQDVTLDFGGLSWPHISVATLVPLDVLEVTEKNITWKS